MHEAPHIGQIDPLGLFLGEWKANVEMLRLGNVEILARLKDGDKRFEVMDNRIERIEHSLATLETDRVAAALALERSATAAGLALERTAAAASATLADNAKRRLTRRDGVIIVGAGALFSSIAVTLSHVYDYVSLHISGWWH